MSTYVVGDIHGCFDDWILLKEKIELEDKEAKFILVGDFLDRGPKVIEMLDWALDNITLDGKYQSVMGNHEYCKIQWWRDYNYFKNKTLSAKRSIYGKKFNKEITYKDFCSSSKGFKETLEKNNIPEEKVKEYIDFIKKLPLYKEIKIDVKFKEQKQKFIIVHADFPLNCRTKDESFNKKSIKYTLDYKSIEYSIVKNNISELIWSREHRFPLRDTIVVHGHTATITDDITDNRKSGHMWKDGNFYNVDCGISFDGIEERNLCALRLEDLTPIYSREHKNTE